MRSFDRSHNAPLIAGCILLIAASPLVWAQNLVGNPGFELPGLPVSPGFVYLNGANSTFMTGWTVTYDGVNEPSYVYRRTRYPDYIFEGDYTLELSDGDTLATSITTVPGLEYVWSLAAAGDDGGGQRFRAGNLDAVLFPARDGIPTDVPLPGSVWRRFGIVFVATATDTQLSIADTPQNRRYSGVLLDSVRVVPCIDLLSHPGDSVTCILGLSTLSVVAAGTGPFSYQWQIQLSDGNWATLGNDPLPLACHSSGAGVAFAGPPDSPTVEISVHGCPGPWPIRCIVSNACGSVTSDIAVIEICDHNADVDCDGFVDLSDLATLLSNFGRSDNPPRSAGNLNGDSAIDLSDLATLLSGFGRSCP